MVGTPSSRSLPPFPASVSSAGAAVQDVVVRTAGEGVDPAAAEQAVAARPAAELVRPVVGTVQHVVARLAAQIVAAPAAAEQFVVARAAARRKSVPGPPSK